MIHRVIDALDALKSAFHPTAQSQEKAPTKLLLCAELLLDEKNGVFETDINDHCRTTSGRNLISTLERKLCIRLSRSRQFNRDIDEYRTLYFVKSEHAEALLRLFCRSERLRLQHTSTTSISTSPNANKENWK